MNTTTYLKKYLIHVVEDDLEQADTLIHYLEEDGRFEVIHSEWAADAIALHAGGLKPALAICDVNLEGEGVGFSVVQDCSLRGIPAIVVTGRKTEELDQLLAATHGSLHYLHKPYQVLVLIRTIENLLKLLNIMPKDVVQLAPKIRYEPQEGVLYCSGSLEVQLSLLETKLMNALVHPGPRFRSKRILATALYDQSSHGLYENLRQVLHVLRKKLKSAGIPIVIEADKGRNSRGYRLVINDSEVVESDA